MSRESRQLSWLLRHAAGEAGLDMDTAGWANVDDVLVATGLDRAALERAVEQNDQGRLQLDGERIRACQGHSTGNMPVTIDALEASWAVLEPTGELWHGTLVAALAGIAARGIEPAARSHVHLAESPDSKVGKRARVEVLLEVSPSRLHRTGLTVFRAQNGVVLVRRVPPDCITGVRAGSATPVDVERACEALGMPWSSTLPGTGG
jgi:putative RNA 2'-phosphotransferase